TEDMEPFGKGKGTRVREWLSTLPERSGYSIILHGSSDSRGASAYCYESLGEERRGYDTVDFVRFSIPLVVALHDVGSLEGLLLEACAQLGPVSGYAGIGIIESPDSSISIKYEPTVYAWAQRFPGLEADYPISHSIWLGKGRDGGRPGIKGVNWFTVLADRWLEELGGREKVISDIMAMDRNFRLVPYAGGLLIRAGTRPQLGDAQRNIWPDLYIELSKYLKPIRIVQHGPFQHGNPGLRFDHERSEAWLRRFDDR
ncbi:MAG TPA: type VI immunity family protein, partial [Candidatus Nanopelagicales bacterium]|nr:type VI immunity family protein [Candidatus Nanopelagicales bacterium]